VPQQATENHGPKAGSKYDREELEERLYSSETNADNAERATDLHHARPQFWNTVRCVCQPLRGLLTTAVCR